MLGHCTASLSHVFLGSLASLFLLFSSFLPLSARGSGRAIGPRHFPLSTLHTRPSSPLVPPVPPPPAGFAVGGPGAGVRLRAGGGPLPPPLPAVAVAVADDRRPTPVTCPPPPPHGRAKRPTANRQTACPLSPPLQRASCGRSHHTVHQPQGAK